MPSTKTTHRADPQIKLEVRGDSLLVWEKGYNGRFELGAEIPLNSETRAWLRKVVA